MGDRTITTRQLIDLNADIGEGAPFDKELLSFVSSCNIACGGHAGDRESIITTLRTANDRGAACGAHPSYPDKENFGRRTLDISDEDLKTSLRDQLKLFQSCAEELQIKTSHVKPHGALYNDAASSPELAALVAQIVSEIFPKTALLGPPNSELAKAATAENLPFITEGFADRAYDDDGRLVPRTNAGAVLETDKQRAAQAVSLALNGKVQSLSGRIIPLQVQSICLHGDSQGALSSAQAIRNALESEGFTIRAPHHEL